MKYLTPIIVIAVLVYCGIMLYPVVQEYHQSESDRVMQIEQDQRDLIDRCFATGGTPSIGYRSFGFPKTYLQRCDYPQKEHDAR